MSREKSNDQRKDEQAKPSRKGSAAEKNRNQQQPNLPAVGERKGTRTRQPG